MVLCSTLLENSEAFCFIKKKFSVLFSSFQTFAVEVGFMG